MKGRKMKKGIAILLVFFVAVFVLSGNLSAEKRWNLKFEQGDLKRISIKTGIKWDAYWYLTYKVTNNTEQSIPMVLGIKAFSDATKTVYYEGYYKRVEEAIEKKTGKGYLNIKDMRTTIEPGESKEAIAIFGKINESTDTLKIQICGLWDRISHEGKKTFIEKKALELVFYRPGDEYFPQYDTIYFKSKKWVVLERAEKK